MNDKRQFRMSLKDYNAEHALNPVALERLLAESGLGPENADIIIVEKEPQP